MADIYVFSPSEANNDYSTMGLVGALVPTSCEFKETANGDSIISMSHPLDEFGRYETLRKGNILVVPVPVRTTPEIKDGKIVTTVWTYKVKPHIQLTHKNQRTLYKKKTGSSKRKVLSQGNVVTVVEKPTGDNVRWKVKSAYGDGWIIPEGFELVTEHKISDNSQSIESVQSAWSVKDQYFRIFEVDKTLNEIKVSARHISYDLLTNKTRYKSAASVTLQTALDGILNNCYVEHEFAAFTNVANEQSGLDFLMKNPIDSFLNPESGVCALFNVSMVRDNYELYFLRDPGMNRDVRIQYRKNMTGINYKESDESVVTRVIPIGENKDGTNLYLDSNTSKHYIDSPLINEYPVIRVSELKCENCKVGDKDSNGGTITAAIARNRMRQQANDYISNGCDKPKIDMSVEFVNLGDTEEYEQFKGLENCFIFDYVVVQHPELSIDVTSQIMEISWDVLTERMKSVQIGSVGKTLANTGITTWQVPSGFSGSKIASDTVGSSALKNDIISARHVQAESINTEALQAQSVTAEKIKAGIVEALSLEAVTAKIQSLTAEDIKTDNLAAAFADFVILTAGFSDFDRATIKHLVSQAMNLEYGTAEQVFIKNLAVEFAQMVSASIGELCIKASDGNYYILDVGADGNVTATKTTVTNSEINSGTTSSGKVIIETNIVASNLNSSNIFSTYALINKIDAARIDADEFFAREAVIGLLRTTKIVSDKSIIMIAGEVENAQSTADAAKANATTAQSIASNAQSTANSASQVAANAQATIDNLEIGGRNIIPFKSIGYDGVTRTDGDSTKRATFKTNTGAYNGIFIPYSLLEHGVDYVLSYDITCLSGDGFIGGHTGIAYNSRFYLDGVRIGEYANPAKLSKNTKGHVVVYMTIRSADESSAIATKDVYIQPQRGSSNPIQMEFLVENLKIEKGNKPTDWTPAPEDVDAEIDSSKSLAIQAQTSADNLSRLSSIEVIEGTFAQTERREGEGIRIYSEIKPRQDLKYGDPYPAGGGRNKLVPNVHYGIRDDVEFIVNKDGSWNVKGTSSDSNVFFNLNYVNSTTSLLPPGDYIVSGGSSKVRVQVAINDSIAYHSVDGGHVKFTIPEGIRNSWVRLQVPNSGVTVDETIYPMVRLASDTDTSYAPPDNICPIEGCAELNAGAYGKNLLSLLNLSNTVTSNVRPTIIDNEINLHVTAQTGGFQQWYGYLKVPKSWRGKTLTFSVQSIVNDAVGSVLPRAFIAEIDSDGNTVYKARLYFSDNKGSSESFVVEGSTVSFLIIFRADQEASFPVDKRVWFGKIQLEEGPVATVYEPYQGTDYMLDFGKNMWNNIASALGHSVTMTDTGFSFVRSASGGSYVYYRHPIKAGETVTFSAKFDNYVMDMYIYEKAVYGTQLAYGRATGRITYTATADYPEATFAITIGSTQGDCNVSDIQIEYGSAVTTYAPYNPDMLEQTGGMVYGATIDWHAGEMVVNKNSFEINEDTNIASSYSTLYGDLIVTYEPTFFPPKPVSSNAVIGNIISDCLVTKTANVQYASATNSVCILDNGRIGIVLSGCTTKTEVCSRLEAQPIQVVYELATPVYIPLTPAIIKSLNGINTIYTDADDGRVEFGHEVVDVVDNVSSPASPTIGMLWLDRHVVPCVLRRWTGDEWETVNDVSLIETIQDSIISKQQELIDAQKETALYLKLDSVNKMVRIGQTGVTSEFQIDAFGSGVKVNNEIFSRFEANRILLGNMQVRKPSVGGLAFDSIKV